MATRQIFDISVMMVDTSGSCNQDGGPVGIDS